MKADPRQMVLDLFPEERPRAKSLLERCIDHLADAGCDLARVTPMAEAAFREFGGIEGFNRAQCLAYFYGTGRHAVPRLKACPPSIVGVFDGRIDYHTVWDRCWAARWIPLREAIEVKCWHYNYREPYTGAPAFVWYIDNGGREVRRPYDG